MLLHNRKEVNPVQKTQVESISSVIDHMDKQETRMCQLEQKIDASSSLSSSASSTPASLRRKEVPLQVRVLHHKNHGISYTRKSPGLMKAFPPVLSISLRECA